MSGKYQRFEILTGRYAFALTTTAAGLSTLGIPVALQSQGADKTRAQGF